MSSETAQLIQLLQQQLQAMERQRKEEKEAMERQRKEEKEAMQRLLEAQEKRSQQQLEAMMKMVESGKQGSGEAGGTAPAAVPSASLATPIFEPFDSSSELWPDYWDRFCTFAGAHAVSESRLAQVFLTNQSKDVYRLLANLAKQQSPPKMINDLTMEEITGFMKTQYDPKRFVVHERFKFWSDMRRKPGETLQELAARIRQDAATCDFASIKDPQDEALRSRFICSVNNEAVLKALFKVKDDELDFARALQIAVETEDAAKVAKETVHGTIAKKEVYQIKKQPGTESTKGHENAHGQRVTCYRCGKTGHKANDCRHIKTTCNYCEKTGHLEKVCRSRKADEDANTVNYVSREDPAAKRMERRSRNRSPVVPKLKVPLQVHGQMVRAEIDTATIDNFLDTDVWRKLGMPQLRRTRWNYQSATKHGIPVLGTFTAATRIPKDHRTYYVPFAVTTEKGLNLLGLRSIKRMGISVDRLLSDLNVKTGAQGEAGRRDCKKISRSKSTGTTTSKMPTVVGGATEHRTRKPPRADRQRTIPTATVQKAERRDRPSDGVAESRETNLRIAYSYKGGDPCYVRYWTAAQKLCWVRAKVIKRIDNRRFTVRTSLGGTTWSCLAIQMRPRPATDDAPFNREMPSGCRDGALRTGPSADGFSARRDDHGLPNSMATLAATDDLRSQVSGGGVMAPQAMDT